MKSGSFLSALTSFFRNKTSLAQPLQIGDPVPSIKVLDHTGESIAFPAACQQGFTFIYFYPKASTPG